MLWCCPTTSRKEYPITRRKFSLACRTTPSRSNSIAACARSTASTRADTSADRTFAAVTSLANLTTLTGTPSGFMIGL